MKELAKPIILPQKLIAVVHYTYSLDCLGRSRGVFEELCQEFRRLSIVKVIVLTRVVAQREEPSMVTLHDPAIICMHMQRYST